VFDFLTLQTCLVFVFVASNVPYDVLSISPTGSEQSAPQWRLLSTGRDRLIESLMDPEDSLFLTTLRLQVLTFLNTLQECLYAVPATHPYAALKNNISLQTLWLQIFNLVVNRRMACLKDVDSLRKYMKYSLKVGRSSVSNVVYHRVKLHVLTHTSTTTTTTAHPLLSLDYWRAHDQSTSGIACMAWIKYIQRCKALAGEATRRIHSPTTLTTLHVLVNRLCKHEYDQIRHLAYKQFDAISARFGAKIVPVIRDVLHALTTTSTTTSTTTGAQYWDVSGALSLLGQSRVQRRIMGDAQLLQVSILCNIHLEMCFLGHEYRRWCVCIQLTLKNVPFFTLRNFYLL